MDHEIAPPAAETKDIEIGAHRYQIARFKARDGSWILAQLLTKILPTVIGAALSKQMGGAELAGANAPALSESEFASIQSHALAVCRRYEKSSGLALPIFVAPDRWAVKELEYDLVTVMLLTVNALAFNLTDFFVGGGLKQLMDTIPGLQSNSPATQP